jgi:hypothetical protein
MQTPSDQEVLRLLVAFLSIMEPEKRMKVLELTAEYSAESQNVDAPMDLEKPVKWPSPR